MDKLEFESLKSKHSPYFEAFYSIYSASLPLREQKPRPEIEELAGRPDYSILLLNKGKQTIGFSVMFVSADNHFALLEYMAVHPDHRSLGYGQLLFQHAFRSLSTSFGPMDGLIEVDSVREDCSDLETRKRRQRFYRRLGCLAIDQLDYILPLPGAGAPAKMDLMVYRPANMPAISKSRLEIWLKSIYTDVYHCNPEDTRIHSMLADLPDPVRLV